MTCSRTLCGISVEQLRSEAAGFSSFLGAKPIGCRQTPPTRHLGRPTHPDASRLPSAPKAHELGCYAEPEPETVVCRASQAATLDCFCLSSSLSEAVCLTKIRLKGLHTMIAKLALRLLGEATSFERAKAWSSLATGSRDVPRVRIATSSSSQLTTVFNCIKPGFRFGMSGPA